MTFKHPANGHVVIVRHAFVWCLLFGCFYLAKHDAWGQAVIALVVAVVTAGLAWLIYPFFARRIVRNAYLRRGWVETTETRPIAA